MNTRQTFCCTIVALCAMVLLNQCVMQSATTAPVQADPRDIAKTTIEILYDESTILWWDGDTYPITMTCRLQDGDGGIVATQLITWTVPVADEYVPGPVVVPFSLTWKFDGSLPPGKYKEYCMSEVDGHYGRSDTTKVGNYYEVNEWRMPCCYGLFFRRVQ